jgi:GT2 family glycosyltransferase
MIPTSSQIGISITTKNRWPDLEFTLNQLKTNGLDSLETIVTDDGSDTPMPSHFTAQFPWVKFLRFDSSQGLTRQRNRITQMLSTPLVLQLDDDSSPIVGSLEAAAAWLMGHPNVGALALRITFVGESLPSDLAEPPPFPAKFFVGCAALLKRDVFLKLGGYEERLGYAAEESDFCLRAFGEDYEIYAYPALVVEHRISKAERPAGKRARQIIRNGMLIGLWYYPFPLSYLRSIPFGLNRILQDAHLRKHWKDVLIGSVQGLLSYFSWPHKKKRLSWQQYQKWQASLCP